MADTPTIDDRTRRALIAVFTDPEQRRQRSKVTSLLGGFATCGTCGSPMEQMRRTDDRVGFYRCLAPRACRRVSVVAIYADRLVTEAFLAAITGPDNIDPVLAGVTGQDRTEAIAAELADLDARERALSVRPACGDISDLVLEGAQSAIGAERAELETELRAEATGQPILTGQQLHTLTGMWDRLDCADRRAAIQTIIKTVTVSKASRHTGAIFDPSRITIAYT